MFLVCQPCNDAQVAAYLSGRYAAGHVGVIVFPRGPLCRIAVMTTVPRLFAQVLQRAVEAGAWVERIEAWAGCVALLAATNCALGAALLLSSTEGGLAGGTVKGLQNGG